MRTAKPAAFAPLAPPVFEPEPEEPEPIAVSPAPPEAFEPSSVLESLEPSAFDERPPLTLEEPEPDLAEEPQPAFGFEPPVSEPASIETEVELEPEDDVPAPVFELEPQAPPLPPPPVIPAPAVAPPPVLTPVPPPLPFTDDVSEISFETSFEDEPADESPLAAMPPAEPNGEMLYEVEDLGAEEVADASVIDVTDMAEVVAEEPTGPASWDPYLEDGLFLTRSRSALLIDSEGRVIASKGDLSANAVDTVAGRLFPAIQQTPTTAPFISLRLGRFFATAVRLPNRTLIVGFVSENPIREELVPLIQKEFSEAR